MIDINRLWNERFQAFLSLFIGYMRFIGNSGLIFALLFFVIFGSYYYSLLIKQIPDSFPVLLCVTLVLTYFIVKTRIRSFLKRADLVFLLAAEEKMKTYFTFVLLYNTSIQMFIIFGVSIVLAPLYEIGQSDSTYSYIVLMVLFLILKGWNVCVAWLALKLQNERSRVGFTILRVTASFIFLYVCVTGAPIYIIALVGFIIMAFLLYFHRTSINYSIHWERLIEMEESLLLRFYRFANAFTDVPSLQKRMKPRKWLVFLTSFIRHRQQAAPFYLYSRVFIRTEPYFGIYVRLLLIGIGVMIWLPYDSGKGISFVLFLFLSAQQLISLSKHYVQHEITTLYPISSEKTTVAIRQLLTFILMIKCFLYAFALVVGGLSFLTGVILFIGSVCTCSLYLRGVNK